MTRLDDGRGNIARLQWIKSKVLSVQVKSRSDIGSMDNLESVIRQNLEDHCMSNSLADADKVSAFLTGVGWKITVIHLVVDRFPEVKTQQGTDVVSRTFRQTDRNITD
jgi:hypothetical protein